jgi:hypothetical protein
MLRGFERNQVSFGRHLCTAALEKQVHFSGELAGFRAQKRLAYGAQRELWIESAFRIEADLTRKDRAVTEASSRHQGRSIEPCRLPPEAKRIIRVA